MKFDLNDLNPPTWFTHEQGGQIAVRAIPINITKKIERDTTKKKVEFKRGQRFEVLNVDDEKQNEMMWDYAIVDWKKITDDKGAPLECTKKNKVALMNGSVLFATWFAECFEIVSDQFQREKEISEKN